MCVCNGGGGDPLSFCLPDLLLVSEVVEPFDRETAFYSFAYVLCVRIVGQGWG